MTEWEDEANPEVDAGDLALRILEIRSADVLEYPEVQGKSDPVFLDTVWTTMTAAKEAGHDGQGAKADHDSWQ